MIMCGMQETLFRAPANDLYYKKLGLRVEVIGS